MPTHPSVVAIIIVVIIIVPAVVVTAGGITGLYGLMLATHQHQWAGEQDEHQQQTKE